MKSTCVLVSFAFFGLAGCSGSGSAPSPSIHLVDLVDASAFGGRTEVEVTPLAVLPPSAWKAGAGVTGLTVRDGKLVGRSSDAHPLIYAELPAWPDPADTVDAVEVDLTISGGDLVQGVITGKGEPAIDAAIYDITKDEAFLKTDVVAALGSQTIRMPFGGTKVLDAARYLHISPTNVADVDFEIEAVRLITTRERLAASPSGVAWQGLGDIFRESIVSRSPEEFEVSVYVPNNSWLDLNIGSLDDRPLTFQVSLADGTSLLEQTLTTAKRWEPVAIDLGPYGGRDSTLRFGLKAAEENTLGLWGTPIVRTRGGRPAVPEPPSASLSQAPPKNVIFIHADTLRRDHLQSYGYERETSPVLAKMIEDGVLFKDNISPGSWTKISTPSIVTSLYPTAHTVANFPDRLPAAATTAAEIYREAGYATVCYSSVMFTGKFTNLHQGYDELHEFGSLNGGMPKSSREYVDRLSDWIDGHPDTPFFAYLHIFDPHSPFEPRSPYNSMWADPAGRQDQLDRIAKLKPYTTEFFYGQQLAKRQEIEKAGVDPESFINYHKDWYDGSIRGMDSEIGRLIERLRRDDVLEDTLIVLFSDHGEEFLEHDGVFHGQSVYGDLTNVPLMFYWPGHLPGGLEVEQTVRSIDILPTALAISGLTAPAKIQGQSLLPLIAAVGGGATSDGVQTAAVDAGWRVEPAVSENVTVRDDELRATALLSGKWRLFHNTFIPEGDDRPEYELFDHVADPLNLRDLAAEQPEIVDQLKVEMAAWREDVKAGQLSRDDSSEAMSPAERKRLESLGYIQ